MDNSIKWTHLAMHTQREQNIEKLRTQVVVAQMH